MLPSDPRTSVDAAFAAGQVVGQTRVFAGVSGAYTVIPEGSKAVDLSIFMNPEPSFVYAKFTARTPASLVAYVTRHGEDVRSALFADISVPSIRAIIDYHTAGNDPGRCDHVAEYVAPLSAEWKAWSGISGKMQGQRDMARFLEENRVDVTEPDGATLLEIVKTLEAAKKVDFKSGIRLDNGNVELAYREVTEGVAGADGKMVIPTEIVLGIPVFHGGQPYKVTMFFRYRIDDGKLGFVVEMHRRQDILDAAFNDIVAGVKAEIGAIPLYEGSVG